MGDRRDTTPNRLVREREGWRQIRQVSVHDIRLLQIYTVYYDDLIPRNDGFQHDDSVFVYERAWISRAMRWPMVETAVNSPAHDKSCCVVLLRGYHVRG